jgi:ADP-heptose:LPS heptosyltransferase
MLQQVMPMPHSNQKVLIIKHGAFGDIVQADGAFRDIRAHHPQAEITLLTTPPFRRLMSRSPHIDRIIADVRPSFWKIRDWLALASTMRAEQFTHIYDLQKSDRSDLYRRLFFRSAHWNGRKPGYQPPSAVSGYITQLTDAGIPAPHSDKPDVSWMADDARAILAEGAVRRPYVALIPGCSAKHPQKRWPYYAELAQALISLGYDVVTAPGPDEIELCKRIPGHTLLGPNGFLNWFELAGVLKDACFVVGNDTGPSHVASCLDKPGLALFGPHTSAARTGICRGEFGAIEVANLAELSVQTVLDAILRKLPAQENSV